MSDRLNQFASVLILFAVIGVTIHTVDAGSWINHPIGWATVASA